MSSIEVLIEEKDVRSRIKELAAVLSDKYAGKDVLLVGILNGCVFFFTALAQEMTIPVEVEFMATQSYGAGTQSSGSVVVTKDIDRNLKGKTVIIVEDIVDSGRTLKLVKEMLEAREPEKVEVVALLDKPDRRVNDFEADYVGFKVPDVFVIGWGLDFDQKYRDLTFIGVYKEE